MPLSSIEVIQVMDVISILEQSAGRNDPISPEATCSCGVQPTAEWSAVSRCVLKRGGRVKSIDKTMSTSNHLKAAPGVLLDIRIERNGPVTARSEAFLPPCRLCCFSSGMLKNAAGRDASSSIVNFKWNLGADACPASNVTNRLPPKWGHVKPCNPCTQWLHSECIWEKIRRFCHIGLTFPVKYNTCITRVYGTVFTGTVFVFNKWAIDQAEPSNSCSTRCKTRPRMKLQWRITSPLNLLVTAGHFGQWAKASGPNFCRRKLSACSDRSWPPSSPRMTTELTTWF